MMSSDKKQQSTIIAEKELENEIEPEYSEKLLRHLKLLEETIEMLFSVARGPSTYQLLQEKMSTVRQLLNEMPQTAGDAPLEALYDEWSHRLATWSVRIAPFIKEKKDKEKKLDLFPILNDKPPRRVRRARGRSRSSIVRRQQVTFLF